eukprot:gene30036-39227_t
MATLQDFPKALQWEFLNHAEQRIPFLPQHRQLLSDVKVPSSFRPSAYGLSDMLMISFLDFIAKSKIVTIKSIHPSLAIPVSTSVSQILDCIQATPNNLEFHLPLFLFPYAVLCAIPTAVLYKIWRRNRNAAQRDYTAARLSAWVSNKYHVMGELLSHPDAPVYPVQAAFVFRPLHSVLSNIRRAEKLVREDGQYGVEIVAVFSEGLAFTSLVNIFLVGLCDPSVSAQLYVSGNLIPQLKKDADGKYFIGSFPSYVRNKWRKMRLPSLPLQFGVGFPNDGIEAILHAFNKLIRGDRVPRPYVVRKSFPAIFPWVYYCYSVPAPLFLESFIIWAQTGVQQGD